MIELKVKIPEKIAKIIPEISHAIYIEAIREVVKQRLVLTQKQLDKVKVQISVYESKYKKFYDDFSSHVPDTMEGHNDWMEWSYLYNVYAELSDKIEKLKSIIR